MFERQFGLRENPFAAGHQSRFVYPSREHQEALAHLRYGIENREPFVLITGEVGTGKTTALYDVLSEWQSRVTVALITNSALTRDELLEEICVRFGVGIPTGITKPQLLIQLERHLLAVRARGDRAILLLDEAQNLHRDLLEEIRLLSNLEAQGDKLMQVFLVGQPELETLLSRPELRQLRQRIAVHYRLHPLSQDDTERYIHHRITVAGGHALTIFPAEACNVVFELTHGIPREINTVCSQAMLNAFVDDSGIVSPEHVRAVARDTEFQSVLRGTPAAQGSAPAPSSSHAPAPAEPSDGEPRQPDPAVEGPRPPSARRGPPVYEPPQEVTPAEHRVAREAVTPPAPEPVDAPVARGSTSVRAAGTPEQWENVLSTLASDRESTLPTPLHPESHSTPASPDPNPSDEVSHESEAGTAHTRSAESWYGPEGSPPSRTPVMPDEPEPAAARAEPPTEWTPEPPPPVGPSPRGARPEFEAPRAAMSSLPPTLRRKLEFIDEEEEARPNGLIRWLVIAGVALVVIVIGVIVARNFSGRGAARTPAVTPVQNPRVTAPADTVPRPTTAPGSATTPASGVSGTRATSPTGSSAARPTMPTTTRTTPAPAPAPTATRPAPGRSVPATIPATTPTTTTERASRPRQEAPSQNYIIAVGTFLDEARANQERDKLGAATGLAARVQTVTEGGDQVYRVVLGSYRDRASAERAAGRLIEAGSVDEARIITAPR